VIYLGTFSKVLFPALRLGYVIVPEDLTQAFERSQAVGGQTSPTVEQAVLADFIREGHFARHIRRMRTRYQRLRRLLETSVQHVIGDALQITGADVGLHVIGRLPAGSADSQISRAAQLAGITVPPVSAYCIGASPTCGLVLGYGHLSETEIVRGVERLATAIRPIRLRGAGVAPTHGER